MGSLGVVVVRPDMHRGVSFRSTVERCGVGSFADAALDEPLGFAVRLGCVGPASLVCDAVGLQGGRKHPAFVGRAVVGHHALHHDAMAFEPGQASVEEGDGIFLALAGQQLDAT